MTNDKISKAATGYHFPFSYSELVKAVELFDVRRYSQQYARIRILMENCKVECDFGYQLCSFLRMGYIAAFSLPDSVTPVRGRQAMKIALEKFREVDTGPRITHNTEQFFVYRAYLGPQGVVSVTRHLINGQSRSYLKFRASSQLSKANRSPKQQWLVSRSVVNSS